MAYVDLHAHSTFSFLDGCNQPEDLARQAAALGRPAMALTEHGNVSSHPRWERACHDAGIKPIFGVEGYHLVEPVDTYRGKGRQRPPNRHLTILAASDLGYRNLLHLVSRSWKENYYYRPHITQSDLADAREDLFILSGCYDSHLSHLIREEQWTQALEYGQEMQGLFGNHFFLEVQLIDFQGSREVNLKTLELANQLSIPVVATADVHMLDDSPQQQATRRLLHQSRLHGGKKSEAEGEEFQYGSSFLIPPNRLEEFALRGWLPEAWHQSVMDWSGLIADACDVTLPKSDFIEFPLPNAAAGQRKDHHLFALIAEGARDRHVDLDVEPYKSRVLYETSLIESKGYIDYFLVVWDLVHWAKAKDILVGPGRGSAAGSLVSWLLGITEVNPLEYGLLFERFIDPSRMDMPDIDIDFEDGRRGEVYQYLEDKYGADRVVRLATFVSWRGRNILDAVGKVHKIPPGVIDDVKDVLGNDDDIDGALVAENIQPLVARYPKLAEARLLQGQLHNFSKHACGILLSDRPVEEVCAVYHDAKTGASYSSVNGDDAEKVGLLKIDVLGLKTLTVIKEVLNAIGWTNDDLYRLPRDLPEVWEVINSGNVMGIFQFEGGANRALISQYPHVTSLMDMSHITALSRPGPLYGGMADDFCDIRIHKKEVPQLHADVDSRLAWTYGQVVYQEQLMLVAREVAGLEWGQVNQLRKGVGKKIPALIRELETEFVNGCVTHGGLPQEVAESIFQGFLKFGGYAFNLSHSISYVTISYWTAYLKLHHPTEFYAAMMRHEDNGTRLRNYAMEWVMRGGILRGPRLNISKASWTAEEEGVIRAGYDALTGVGDKKAELLEQEGPFADRAALVAHRSKQPTDANPERVTKTVPANVLAALDGGGVFEPTEDNDYLGLRSIAQAIEWTNASDKVSRISRASEGDYLLAGVVHEVKRKKLRRSPQSRPNLDHYLTFTLEDDTGQVDCMVNRFDASQAEKMLTEALPESVILVSAEKRAGDRRIMVRAINVEYQRSADGTYVHAREVEAL